MWTLFAHKRRVKQWVGRSSDIRREFRRQMVELFRAGMSDAALGLSAQNRFQKAKHDLVLLSAEHPFVLDERPEMQHADL